jgi:hypothetical protein
LFPAAPAEPVGPFGPVGPVGPCVPSDDPTQISSHGPDGAQKPPSQFPEQQLAFSRQDRPSSRQAAAEVFRSDVHPSAPPAAADASARITERREAPVATIRETSLIERGSIGSVPC